MSILIFIIILAILILSHEFGHFIVAKKTGMRVDEFGIGFPPRLFAVKKGETEYSINAIPFGGFVKIFGETPSEETESGPDSSRSMTNKPKWMQATVLAAGVVFNIILAWLLLSAGLLGGLPVSSSSVPAGGTLSETDIVITQVMPESPAAKEGFALGDAVIELSVGEDTLTLPESVEPVQEFIARHGGEEIAFTVERGEEQKIIAVTPESGVVGQDRPAIGVSLDEVGIVSLPPHLAVIEGARFTASMTVGTLFAFGELIGNAFSEDSSFAGTLVGPVGIVGLVGDAQTLGFAYLMTFTALISINLAIINLIPFPALDGGRLLFLIIEAIKGSPIPMKVSNALNLAGFVLLITLMLVVTFFDIVRLF